MNEDKELSWLAKLSIYLSAPHSHHADPAYFPWCEECQRDVQHASAVLRSVHDECDESDGDGPTARVDGAVQHL
jgi:hypothetical protein